MALTKNDKQFIQDAIQDAVLGTQSYLEGRMDRQLIAVLAAIDSLKEQETEDVIAAYKDIEELKKVIG